MQYDFFTADVFTKQMFSGAQIAVFPHAEGLSSAQMQLLAREMNLTESVFLLPAENSAHTRKMRIFSPHEEIAFAGHPIIAAAYVMASLGEIVMTEKHTHLTLEQNTGPIDAYVTQQDGEVEMVQFTLAKQASVDDYLPRDEDLADMLGLEVSDIDTSLFSPLVVNAGDTVLVIPVKSYRALRAAKFSYNKWSSSSAPTTLAREILLFCQDSKIPEADFHARRLGPRIGVTEDPPIGTAMPIFTSYLCVHAHIKLGTYTFTIARGSQDTRLSILNIEMDNRGNGEMNLRVGGPAVLVSQGTIKLPD